LYCGVKQDHSKLDLSLIVSDRPAAAAGVYTKNLVFAASVGRNRSITPCSDVRAVVINSGNANACTGQRGDEDAEHISQSVANLIGCSSRQVLGLSTGVIGVFLPLEKIQAGIVRLATELGRDDAALERAARGMMTTDTVPKIASRTLSLGGQTATIAGVAKGAAMIGPNMATMLSVVFTDVALDPQRAQEWLSAAVDRSFNCISVDGHMSTNDTVLLLANGAAVNGPPQGPYAETFRTALNEVCTELAKAIPTDGEGATHLVTIELSGASSQQAAHRLAKSVAESPLVKTAIAGADPNWGRIVSALGYAGVEFDPAQVALDVNGHRLFEAGAPVSFNAATVSAAIRDQRDTLIRLTVGQGPGQIRFWTTDLTAEYVRLNADYTT
jgi:glutamate N-acetyltransferase/amino-acid N-acetyltransferase